MDMHELVRDWVSVFSTGDASRPRRARQASVRSRTSEFGTFATAISCGWHLASRLTLSTRPD